jgi:hypothetical protein
MGSLPELRTACSGLQADKEKALETEQQEQLQEYVDSRGVAVRVDRHRGVLAGVKLIGLKSRNGRRYRETALAEAVVMYEGAKVNVNHPKEGSFVPRDYQDRLGVVRGVEFRAGEGLFGDLHFNPKHALAEQLVWDAEHNPRNVGFSHNVEARLSRDENGAIVEAITRVQSVDLVADPATTDGLFEQVASPDGPALHLSRGCRGEEPMWDVLTVEALQLHRPDLLAEIEAASNSSLKFLREETEARIAVLERGQRISELLCKYGLPVPARLGIVGSGSQGIVNAAFIETLLTLADDGEIERRIAERAELVREASSWQGQFARGPKSRDQLTLVEARHMREESAVEFARGIKGR